MEDNNWDTLIPVVETKQENPPSIDWSMEVYTSAEYIQTQSVTPDYSTMEFLRTDGR